MRANEIRDRVLSEEIDSIQLTDILSGYKRPRDKIRQLLKDQALIRVKKGLYVFGPKYARQAYCKEVLANLIYGPSAISLEYALSFYQLIPERVFTVTSITDRRTKYFNTPVGSFSYRYLRTDKYCVGITQKQLDENHFILIATPEKALADLLLARNPPLDTTSYQALEDYLYVNLRIDSEQFANFDGALVEKIAKVYRNNNIDCLASYIRERYRG